MIKNIDKINARKKEGLIKALSMIENINKRNRIIDRVIVFGSSVTDSCRKHSDLDVCFVSDFDCSNMDYFNISSSFEDVSNSRCDIFNYARVKGPLKSEIDSKGVLVYEY